MKNNSSNNIFSDLRPINLKSFSLSQFKSILEYHCVYKNDSPYEVLIYDCNKNILYKYFEFELYLVFKINKFNNLKPSYIFPLLHFTLFLFVVYFYLS
jgi:hypothetical protein